ncbi:hypothetical protein ANN_13591, partial [Periplaneta americana]
MMDEVDDDAKNFWTKKLEKGGSGSRQVSEREVEVLKENLMETNQLYRASQQQQHELSERCSKLTFELAQCQADLKNAQRLREEIINIPTDTPDAMLYAPRRLRGLGVFKVQWEAYLQHLNICQRLLHVDNPHVAATRNLPNEIEHCIKQLPITFDCSECISSQKLRKALREDSFHQWSKLKSKGLGVVFYSHWKKGNSWISTKKGLSSSQWTQAIKMNCNTIPVCTLPGRTLDSTCCRRCDEQETLPHVLGFCHHGELLRINRHNTVRSLIAASIRQNASYEVYEEVGCVSSDGSTRRADIIIIDRQKDKGVILDPTIRFEMHEQQPQEVCREKQVIYEPCCQHLGAQYHITHWTVIGLMFGACGTIPRETLNQLKQYKISDATIDAIGSHVLKSSLAIISNHLYPTKFLLTLVAAFQGDETLSREVENQLATVKEQLKKYKDKVKVYNVSFEQLLRFQELEGVLQDAQVDHEHLVKELDEAERVREELSVTLSDKEASLQRCLQDLLHKQRILDKQLCTLDEKDERIAALESEVKKFQDNVDNGEIQKWDVMCDALQEENKDLNKKLKEAQNVDKNEIKKWKEMCEALQVENEDLNKKLKEAQNVDNNEIKKLKEMCEALQVESEDLNKKLKEAQNVDKDEIKKWKEMCEALQVENEDLNKKLKEAQNVDKDEIKKWKEMCEVLQVENEDLNKKLKDSEDMISKSTKQKEISQK